MRVLQTEFVDDRAEGLCMGIPYDTNLASINGVHIHFWTCGCYSHGDVQSALKEARWARDIVSASYSHNWPNDFWADAHIGMRIA